MTYLTPQSAWYGQQPTWFGPAMANANNRALSAAQSAQREMDRILDELGGWPSAAATGHAVPRLSLSETDNAVEIEVELPGVDEKDLEVALNEDVLTIKGEKRADEQQKDYCHQERTFGRFTRSITLPFDPDPKTVKTLFAKGVLKITLPKSAGVKQHTVKIPVRAAA